MVENIEELEKQNILLHHVVLSRTMPQEQAQFPEDGLMLMEKMIENVENLAESIPKKTVELFERLKRINRELTEDVVSDEIADLKPGDTFAMLIRQQYSVFMVHVLRDADLHDEQAHNVVVATFPTSLYPKHVYEHDSDLEFNYPSDALKVKFSKMLQSKEFANQLILLDNRWPIGEFEHNNHVFKWLMTLLADEKSTTPSTEKFPIVTKKIRDESFSQTVKQSFRRSGVYMSMKVILQHSLTMELGAEIGKFVYKIVMLKFLVEMCEFHKNAKNIPLDIDLLSQMIAKMARRIEKLAKMIPTSITETTTDFYENAIRETKETIQAIRAKIDRQIHKIQKDDKHHAQLRPLTDLDFETDVRYEMPTLEEYLRARSEASQRAYNPKSTIKSPNLYIDPEMRRWIEFENMVLHQLSWKNEQKDADEIRQWLIDYRDYAVEKYKGNPVMTSRMMLVHLKLIALLDRRAILEYPLYKKYRCGINSNMVTSLLLPQRSDTETALFLEKHFRMRNATATYPGLIEENHISENSFSVKFANDDIEMRDAHVEILRLDAANIARKKSEWVAGRKNVERLREKARQLGCSYYTDHFGDQYHNFRCQRCYTNKQANKVRLEEYEHLLPNAQFEQLAVVFELRIPNLIACLRDVLGGFVKLCTGKLKPLQIKGNWVECEGLIDYNLSTSRFVTLGSTKRRNLNHIHVDEGFDKFIVNNSLNCVFHAFDETIPTSLADDAIKSVCTFKTQDEYLGLQWTLNTTTHTENQVLARQAECPQNLSISEYKHFGALRADGHRMQLRKLYGLIETEALSFEKTSVLSLIMQTLWECGYRDTHVDFSDTKFCSAMIELLSKYVGHQEDNWMHPFKLLMATLIAVRVFEINDNEVVAKQIVHLLCSIRAIVWEWDDKINEVIEKTIRCNSNDSNEENHRDLRLKLIYVAMIGCLTFFVYPKHKHYEEIFSIGNDLIAPHRSWLHFIILLRNNLMMYEKNENQLPSHLQIFLRLIEIIGVHLQPKMVDLIQQNPHELFEVIKKHWFNAAFATTKTVTFQAEHSNICVIEAIIELEPCELTIDIVSGLFLVNGDLVSQLPLEIIQDEAYQRVFGNAVLEVKPIGRQRFTTIYNGFHYEFRKIYNVFIITERDKEIERELIHHKVFRDEFPFLLSRDYCHWWNKQENSIEFRTRQRSLGQKFASGEAKVDYRLDLTTRHLIELKTKRIMLDAKSDSFHQIVYQLKRLEYRSYIHVMLESPRVATVELVRMKLKFKIDCSSDDIEYEPQLVSNEFSGMRVSRAQKIGTLYGLNNGLILENSFNDSKILLMPHNDDIFIERTDSHVFVRINTKVDIQNPPFYQYQVDEICQQLKASNSTHSSWFYLAYLHAITSHGQIEPFTGMSGTERALQILHSAFAWSSSPYEPEAIKMLMAIAKLTPIRKMIAFNQSVTFPENIPPHSAQDSFIFIVKKLLDDSQRLSGLHSNATKAANLDVDTDLTLNERDYHRCLQYQPNLRVSEAFIEHKILKTSLPQLRTFTFTPSTQAVSILYHNRNYKVPTGLNLLNFLTNRTELKVVKCVSSILNHNLYEEFPDIWICLYDSIRKQELNDEEMALIFSFFAHQNEEFEPAVLALQAVAMNPVPFQQIDPPAVDRFDIEHGTYDKERMSNILKFALESTELSEELIKALVDQVIGKITESWPCDSINLLEDFAIFGDDAATLNLAVNQRLIAWNNNRKLYDFIDNVQNCLKSLPKTSFPANVPLYFPVTSDEKEWPKTEIDFNETIREHFSTLNDVIDEAKGVWINDDDNSIRLSKVWWLIIEDTWNLYKSKHLMDAGLLPRLAPSSLLSQLLSTHGDGNLKYLVGAWAVTVAREQREKRIKMYSERPELQATMEREIENKPHANWKPCKRPEWLIFEIEQNITIREIQIKVAEQMIEPPTRDGIDARHSVMQLNMGEGKTAVIVPILAAVLADGTQACQITVLKSMFSRNLKFLRQYLGGLLNRRVYIFPCRRNLPVGLYIEQIQEIYEECKATKGVILTLPEYRLSMELKVCDSIGKGDIRLAKSFMDVHKWQTENVRNILDESDAILQANYQLIYTIGNQLEPDGGSQRWTVAQALLKRIPYHMKTLYEQNGKDKIEYDDKYIKKGRNFGAPKVTHRPDVFIPCRILDDGIFEKLKTALADDFLNGRMDIDFPELNDTFKETIKSVLVDKTIDKKPSSLIDYFPQNEQNIIMILSGLLRFEVIKLVLTKRWRVNYGVDPNSQRKMAIPFKAKDVATESTEFGHPDVAICFTQICYYYSGLTDGQLRQLFELLESKQNAVSTYAKWIQSIPSKLINRSIRSYTGINIDDLSQRSILFSLLRFNMHVIDFWLENFVYPYEAKIFEQKLMCTAWDLTSEQLTHCVTGFSGTNDTKNTLPMPIAQNDLAELESTNENVRQILLQPENQSYESLPVNVSGMEILERLTQRRIPVLLDSGALMLELTNKQVANEWLKKTSEIDYDAAVYFDSHDCLQAIDRNGIVTEFDFSVYRENLNRCLVYLDDMHTRGTDLKFPLNWKACVTLSGDIPRDKTVQSCMRMRQLGTNHQICFWASCEADIGIRKICNLSADDCITNEHVIEFISNNSRRLETMNMVHWTAAALNYTKKIIGQKSFDETDDEDSMENLFEKCVDNEFVDLNEMYGDKEETLLRDIAWSKFDKIASEFRHRSHSDIKTFVRNMQDRVDEILDKLAPNVKQFSSSLDEEQEKELEQEIEEQRIMERPPAMKPAQPSFDDALRKLLFEGSTDKMIEALRTKRSLFSIATSLQHTQLFRRYHRKNKEAWAKHLFVTKDFRTVIDSTSESCDEFLRPVWWIAHIKGKDTNSNTSVLLLLSTHECNCLLTTFQKSTKSALFMYRPRLNKQHSSLLHEPNLQITKMDDAEATPQTIDVSDEVQIGMYAGMMYFGSEVEQDAYCNFMGLIPRPRTKEQDEAFRAFAFENDVSNSKGFVPMAKRRYSEAISSCVGKCKFNDSPVDLAIKLIEAHHQTLLKESHVASILERTTKLPIENNNNDETINI